MNEMEEMLTGNTVLRQRSLDIEDVRGSAAFDYGFTGVMLRGSGVFWDVRLMDTYDSYNLYNFSIPVGIFGDSYDRYLIRIEELRESTHIMSQCISFLQGEHFLGYFDYNIENLKMTGPSRSFIKSSM